MSALDLIPTYAPVYVDDSRIEGFIAIATRMLTVSTWGGVYYDAVALLACHMRAKCTATDDETDALASGPVTSRKAGDLSINYGGSSAVDSSGDDADLRSTSYGQIFLQLRNTRAEAQMGLIDVNG